MYNDIVGSAIGMYEVMMVMVMTMRVMYFHCWYTIASECENDDK
jgi:hypothetical protein